MKDQHIIKRDTESLELEKPLPYSPTPTGYAADADDGEGIHLRDYWRAVRKRLWLIAGVVIIVTLLATFYMARQPDVYVAQSRVQVDLESAGAGLGTSKSQSVIINNPINDPTYFNTQLQILTSPGLLRRVVKTLDLEHDQSFLNPESVKERSSWRRLLNVLGVGRKSGAGSTEAKDELPLTTSVAPAVSREDLAEARRLAPFVSVLRAGLRVEPVKESRTAGYIKDTRLIDISFRHPDPQMAARIVNIVADTFVLANLEKKTETNTSTGSFLQKRVAELQSKIRTGEEQLADYARSHQIVSLTGDQNIVADRLAGLNRQLLEAENERKLAEAAFRAGQEPKAAAALGDSSSKQPADTQGKLDELRQKRAQLSVKYQDTFPAVVEVDKQIAELERQLQSSRTHATQTAVTNLETRYKQSLAREQSLRSALEKQRNETVTQNDAAINYRIIQQEIETNKGLLNDLLQRSRENDVVLTGTPNNISVVDYALAPDFPIGPKRTQSITLAMLLSLAFGTGLAIFLEYLNDTVRSSDDVERLLRLPALSVIPTTAGGARRMLPAPRLFARRRLHTDADGEHPELILNADARSPLVEAYRHLRTQILLSRAGQHPRTLLVTSSLPGEGKTTTSINTALTLAQTGARVAVVDADLRRPRLHHPFGVSNAYGLSTILSSEMSDDEILAMLRHHEESNLHLLTAGPTSPSPAELLGSEQMRRMLALLSSKFDYVIVDSPPLISFTDGVLISTMVDGVVLIVHGGRTSPSLVRRSKQVLQDVGARLLGVVLNNVELQSDDYYYYQHYHSYYEAQSLSIKTEN